MQPDTIWWLASSEEDWGASLLLREGGFFAAAVLHAHLAVEKLLKALIIENQGLDQVSYTHNLPRLMAMIDPHAPRWLMSSLAKLSPAAIEARYASASLEPKVVYSADVCEEFMRDADEAKLWLSQQLT